MTTTLANELDSLPKAITDRLAQHHFDRAHFLEMAQRLADPRSLENRVRGTVTPPEPQDVQPLPARDSKEGIALAERGRALLAEGRCALIVLAGGMATRMGGVVKALVPALPGKTFLDLRLGEQQALERLANRKVPLWLMTSAATEDAIRDALGSRVDGKYLATFRQRLSVRVTPEGTLFRDSSGAPSEYAPGHGDIVDAVRDSGLLQRFLDGGGTVLTVANLDNLGATLDPLVLGFHAEHGRAVTCEVVDKVEADRGGIPVRHDGRPVVLEEFRLPEGFDASTVRVFSTNTFHFDARALAALQMPWSYFVVNKKVEGKPVVQFERLIGELTSYLDTVFLRVPRSGAESRFLPVKDHDELKSRQADLELVARARGMLG